MRILTTSQLNLRASGGSPVTKPTQWWQMTIVPHWDYHHNLQLTTNYNSRFANELLSKSMWDYVSIQCNCHSDSLRQPCWFSKRVCDLTQRLEDHKIEYQHRYRRSRKSSTGCGGLRALYMLMMFVAMQRHGHAEAVHPVCGGSSPPISVDVVTNSI